MPMQDVLRGLRQNLNTRDFLSGCQETKIYFFPSLLCLVMTMGPMIVGHVVASIWTTALLWWGIYGCTTTRQSLFFHESDDLTSGMMNAGMMLSSIVFLSLILSVLALKNFRRVVTFWITAAGTLSMMTMAFLFCSDALSVTSSASDEAIAMVASAFTVVYITTAYMAFFGTSSASSLLKRHFVILQSTLVALFYLSSMPSYTVWCMLVVVSCWDVFAVLSSWGPLRIAQERASEYSEGMIRMLVYSVVVEDKTWDPKSMKKVIEDDSEKKTTNGIDGEKKEVLTDCKETKEKGDGEMQAEKSETESDGDAEGEEPPVKACILDEGSHLGLGDFIFFSLLVGRSFTSGFLPAGLATIGIVVGLDATLNARIDEDEAVPALPLPVALGILGHLLGIASSNAASLALSFVF